MVDKHCKKVNKLLKNKKKKTPNIQTNCYVHYLDYSDRKTLQSNIETLTMPSTREKEKKIQQWLKHKRYM